MIDDTDLLRRLRSELDATARQVPLTHPDSPPPRPTPQRRARTARLAGGAALVGVAAGVAALVAIVASPGSSSVATGGGPPGVARAATGTAPVPRGNSSQAALHPRQSAVTLPAGRACPATTNAAVCQARAAMSAVDRQAQAAAQAALWAERCVTVNPPPPGAAPMVLRDTAVDAGGTILLLADTTGWETCNVAPQSTTARPSMAFQTWAATDGWHPHQGSAAAQAPTGPDYYLVAPVEIQSYTGGVVAGTSKWRQTVIGRAAPAIRRVTVTVQPGLTMTARVHNGMYIAERVLASPPPDSPGPIRIAGYDAHGHIAYDSAPTAAGHATCWTTPTGQPLTPPIPGRTCRTGIPWA
jgi:hypothetical protein